MFREQVLARGVLRAGASGGITLSTGLKLKGENLVRKEGFEPPRPFGHKILSLARLPVPPLPHAFFILSVGVALFHRDFALF